MFSVLAEFNMSRGGLNVTWIVSSDTPLPWMSHETISDRLKMKLSNVEKWGKLGTVNESLTGNWKLFELLQFKHPKYGFGIYFLPVLSLDQLSEKKWGDLVAKRLSSSVLKSGLSIGCK